MEHLHNYRLTHSASELSGFAAAGFAAASCGIEFSRSLLVNECR